MLRRAQCLQLSLFDVTATSLAHATSLALPPQRSQPLQRAVVPVQRCPERSWYLFNVANPAPEQSWYLFNVATPAL